jgi:hypothetical protein
MATLVEGRRAVEETEEALVQVFEVPNLVDARAQDAQGQDVGTITDIIVSLADGQVPYVVLSANRQPEAQPAAIPIPWDYLDFQGGDDNPQVVLTVAAKTLADAPTVDLTTWPGRAGADWDAEIQTFWNSVPASK